MNYCPECGKETILEKVENDVATDHYHYSCHNGHRWVETMTKRGELLLITTEEDSKETV